MDEAPKPAATNPAADPAAPIIPHLQWLANVAADLERHTHTSQVAGFRRDVEANIDAILAHVRSVAPTPPPIQ